MLLSLKLNNCYIFNKEIDFTMRANMHYRKLKSNVLCKGNADILKSAIIFGPNNTGKTSFVKCILSVKEILLDSGITIGKNIFSNNDVCDVSLEFEKEGNQYLFAFKYDSVSKQYVYEKFSSLSFDKNKNRKETVLWMKDTINNNFESIDDWIKMSMQNASSNNILIYLLDTSKSSILFDAKNVLTGFAHSIDIVDMNNIPIQKTINLLKSSKEYKERIANFVKSADLSLEDYRYLSDDELSLTLSVENGNKSEEPQEKVLKTSAPIIEMLHLASVYNGVPVPSIVFDSTGTKKIAALAGYVIDAIDNERLLVIDELDNSLHFKLTRNIVSLFNNELNEKSQLIATVHDATLLDCNKLFRKEQIWFTHKDSENAYLYSLSEFTAKNTGVRDTTDLLEKYKKGAFGALPNPDLFKSLLERAKA